jgi:hypothetical protein
VFQNSDLLGFGKIEVIEVDSNMIVVDGLERPAGLPCKLCRDSFHSKVNKFKRYFRFHDSIVIRDGVSDPKIRLDRLE